MSKRKAVYVAAVVAGIGAAIAVVAAGGDAITSAGTGGGIALAVAALAAGREAYKGVTQGDADGDGAANIEDEDPLNPDVA